ncbi:unnamed protein product [Onchocerca flexuosa]|uniref:Uncharacterized protein n=1 Tax=Onchocerca flexuosa TaxID=387005 RepID=A0A183I4U2_9BILA|nr:unnamed protein product [Onchocerca flexuosa]
MLEHLVDSSFLSFNSNLILPTSFVHVCISCIRHVLTVCFTREKKEREKNGRKKDSERKKKGGVNKPHPSLITYLWFSRT